MDWGIPVCHVDVGGYLDLLTGQGVSRKVDESGASRQDRAVEHGTLCCAEHAPAEEIEVRPAVHLPLEKLGPVHLTLRLTIAPSHRKPSAHRRLIG